MRTLTKAIVVACSVAMTACATSPEAFRRNPYQVSDSQLCRTLTSSAAERDYSFKSEVRSEVERRGLSDESCATMVRNQNVAIGAVALIGAVAVAAARNGGGGGGGAPSTDYDWDWDQFYNEYRQLVWACRGVQTGQFADTWRCNGKFRTDARWPQK
jgi:hypothetical protein